jgi:hypothetical protein
MPRRFVADSTRLLNRRRPRSGISVVEFLVAATLILAVLIGSGITLASAERSLARDRARDRATAAASSILEQAALFRCQHVPDPEVAAVVSLVCWERITQSASTVDPTLAAGDVEFDFFTADCPVTDPGCSPVSAELSSRWIRATEPALCPSSSPTPPALLERQLTLTWRTARDNAPISSDYRSLQAVPLTADYQRSTLRSIAVVVSADESVRLSSASGAVLLRRGASCTTATGVEQTEVWFPFLPPAAYTVSVTAPEGATLRSVEIAAGELDACAGVTVVRGSSTAECLEGGQ